MDSKATIVKAAVKGSKAKAQSVKVVNTPTVKIDHSNDGPTKMPPTLRLDSLDLPAIKNWKVGSTYKLNLTVKMTSLNQGNDYDMIGQSSDKSTRAGFQVTSVGAAS